MLLQGELERAATGILFDRCLAIQGVMPTSNDESGAATGIKLGASPGELERAATGISFARCLAIQGVMPTSNTEATQVSLE